MTFNHHTGNQFLEKLAEITEANLGNEKFGVPELAKAMGISRSGLHRKLVSLTHLSASAYIRQARLKRARELIRRNAGNISEIAWEVGFASVTYFNKSYHDTYGYPPGEENNHPAEAVAENDSKEQPVGKNRKPRHVVWWVAGLAAIVLLSFGIVHFISPERNGPNKTIAVLPFIDDSRDPGHAYIIEGLREEILNKLTMIGGIDVVSRTTSETYRKAGKTMKQIGRELNAGYIMEGSAQTINHTLRIRLQLIETSTDRHLWSKPFERQLTPDNIFEIQQEVALLVAGDLGAIVTGKEKEKITMPFTKNKTAYNLFLQGLNYWKVYEKNKDYTLLSKARELYFQALAFDSTYIEPYIEIGWTYYGMSRTVRGREHINYLDTGLMFAGKAICYNPESSRAYLLKAHLLITKGDFDEAIQAINRSIHIDPNLPEPYSEMAYCYFTMNHHAQAVGYYLKARKLNKEPLENKWILQPLYASLTSTGFKTESRKFVDLILAQENDSANYFYQLWYINFYSGDYEESVKIGEYRYRKDTANLEILFNLCQSYIFLRDYDALNDYFVRYERLLKNRYPQASGSMLGFMYMLNGQAEAAKACFDRNIRLSLENKELNGLAARTGGVALNLSTIYSVLGEKEKALEQLKQLKKRELCPLRDILDLKMNPMYDNIRETPEFKDVLKDLEAKYQKGHEIVRKVMIREGLLES